MKYLQDILKNVKVEETRNFSNQDVASIEFDSRNTAAGVLFVAIKGTQTDGHRFIGQAIEQGCTAIVCESLQDVHSGNNQDVSFFKVSDSQQALAVLASNFFDNPSEKLKLTGVTGTNGKTTVVTLLYRLFLSLGYNCGMLSTVENRINEVALPATHTTPDPVSINKLLHQMVEEGVSHCFMEVSSHAIDQKRIAGLRFVGGVFTNITQDHLDYHNTFKAYIYAKKAFFDNLPAKSWALVNTDDKNGLTMLQNCKATKHTFSLRQPATYKGKILDNGVDGLLMLIDKQEIWLKLVGKFNAYNIMAVTGTARLLGEDSQEILSVMSNLPPAEGRFEVMEVNSVKAIVDYAHTPDALKNVLQTIDTTRTHREQLITVVGAGGNRDKGKRPQMAQIAARYSDKLILTSDNPRFEKPEDILEDMVAGLDATAKKNLLTITSRREAIKTACMLAQKGDIILVAGKGHEKYQEIAGERHHFDDKEQLNEFLK